MALGIHQIAAVLAYTLFRSRQPRLRLSSKQFLKVQGRYNIVARTHRTELERCLKELNVAFYEENDFSYILVNLANESEYIPSFNDEALLDTIEKGITSSYDVRKIRETETETEELETATMTQTAIPASGTRIPNVILADALKQQMNLWRMGERAIPHEYIALHKAAAESDLNRFINSMGCENPCTGMVSEGHMDGMKVLRVFATERGTGTIRQFQWSPANGGSWGVIDSGWTFIEVAPNAPGNF